MAAPKLLDRSAGPEMLDRYELVAELASGGMATVFLARLAGVGGFQRFVAIKRLHPHLSSEPDFVQMFLDEARLAASIHHPHVVPILEVGTSEAGFYVVMEYVEGDTLARLVARHTGDGVPFPTPVTIRVALDTLAGLHAAHELHDDDGKPLQLVHRDVSPQNVLVGVDGSARLTDFGVARASSRLASTQSGTLKGKLAYMPPEQAKGDDAIDRRADVFAMAIIVWELIAGRRLFRGSTELETLNKLMFEPIPRLSVANARAPAEIDEVLARALSRKPEQRYPTAADFADALERAAQATVGVATVRQVAEFVQTTIGKEVQESRAAVRAWLTTDPSHNQRTESVDALLAQAPVSSTGRLAPLVAPPAATLRPHMITLKSSVGDPASASAPVAVPVPSQDVQVDIDDPSPPQRSRAPLLAVAAIFVVALLATGGWFAFGRSPAKGDPPPASAAAPSSHAPEPPAPGSSAPPQVKVETTSIDALPTAEKTPTGAGPRGGPPAPATTTKAPDKKTADPPKAPDPPTLPKPPSDDYKNPYR